jgi:hypothetical protein
MPPQAEELASAEQTAVVRDEADRLWRAIPALPRRQREALVLRYFCDLGEAAIADTRGRVARVGEAAREPRHGCPGPQSGGPGMTTPELERKVRAVLNQRAQDAMNRTNTKEHLADLLAGHDHDRLRRRRRLWAASGVLAAAAAVTAVLVTSPGRDDTAEPAAPTDTGTASPAVALGDC